jgi:hypothetical protein
VGVQTWHRAILGALLVGAVAAAGIALNFTLLRLTQDAHDPVGRMSPRAVFAGTVATTPATADDTHIGPTITDGHDHDSDD